MKIIKKFTLGYAQTNSYLIMHDNEYILIDAPENSQNIIEYLTNYPCNITKILLTHGHYDHIAGLNDLKNAYPDVKIYISNEEFFYLTDPNVSLAALFNSSFTYSGEVFNIKELELKNVEFKYIAGHSIEGTVIIFKDEQVVFSGDSLFNQSIGRSDFMFGDQEKLLSGIKEHLLSLPNSYKVYPGHGLKTSIGFEKGNNRYIKEVL